MIKNIYLTILLFLMAIQTSQAVTSKIAIIIDNHAITDLEIDQRIRFIMLMQGIDPVKNKPSTFYGYFLNTIIDNDLLVSRIKQTGGAISKEDLESGIEYMSQMRKITSNELINRAIKEYGMTKAAFMDCVKDDMIMQIMFLSPLGNDIKISDEEIKNEAIKESIKPDDKEGMQMIKGALMQKAIGQKAKQIIQNLRQSVFIEIKR